jgi:hypothetical protein
MTVTAQKDHSLKRDYFRHEKTGAIFRLLFVANEGARESVRGKWIVTAIYEDSKQQIWASPLKDFKEKFVEIDANTGKKI